MKYAYDREKMIERTKAEPTWLHFGAGNIFRAFPCAMAEKLLSSGDMDRGIIAAEGFDEEIIEKAYRPFGNESLLVTLCGDGGVKKLKIGSVAESLTVTGDRERLKEIAGAGSLSLISFTITEKGYAVRRPDGELYPTAAADIKAGPDGAKTTMAVVAALLYARYGCGGEPVSLVSMDNCSGNGDKLKAAVLTFAEGWMAEGFVDGGFIEYLSDEGKVAFPCSMIDKITPRPDPKVAEMLRAEGEKNTDIIVTEKKTYTSYFVNAEATEYLVIEDKFPAGRPPLHKAGVIFTDRKTVENTEKMKVSTCLNPLHTALAIYGCLLGHSLISEEMGDPQLFALVRCLGYDEGLRVVTDPGIISPAAFLDEVVKERLPNPFMPDAPQRIATDTSQKLPIRFGETVKAYIERELPMSQLKAIPLVAAGWCRYLMAVTDDGEKFTPSPDPRFEECSSHLRGITLGGEEVDVCAHLKPILSDPSIFGVDLYHTPIAWRAEEYFREMIRGKGAVRELLKRELTECDGERS